MIKRLYNFLIRTKVKTIAPKQYVEKDTKCDKCEYLQECISNGSVVNCRSFDDTRDRYIKGRGSFGRCDAVESLKC